MAAPLENSLDLKDIKGKESAKRALEIAAAGGRNLLLLFLIDRNKPAFKEQVS